MLVERTILRLPYGGITVDAQRGTISPLEQRESTDAVPERNKQSAVATEDTRRRI